MCPLFFIDTICHCTCACVQSNHCRYVSGITLTPALSYLRRSCSLYCNYLNSDPLQFGFKKESGCSHALFAFSESIKHYNKRGSKVYCAFLDASKAFDKVLINDVIVKLIKKGAPIVFVRILYYWFNNLSCSVAWNGLLGSPFLLQCGIRQPPGGVLSPFLFAIYADDLIVKLRQSGFGLHVGSLFVGCVLYADEIALLSCSCHGLQKLIDIQYVNVTIMDFNGTLNLTRRKVRQPLLVAFPLLWPSELVMSPWSRSIVLSILDVFFCKPLR